MKPNINEKKGFTLKMLVDRWKIHKEEVLELLSKHKVPGHLNHTIAMKSKSPMDSAIFFEEYIYQIEKSDNLTHSKLKSKSVSKIYGNRIIKNEG